MPMRVRLRTYGGSFFGRWEDVWEVVASGRKCLGGMGESGGKLTRLCALRTLTR